MSTKILNFVAQYTVYSESIIVVLGFIGNTLNILVFTQLKSFRENRCTFYLTIESISSFLFQFILITLTILTSIYGNDATGLSLVWCKLRYALPQIILLITFYSICFAAVDQFFSTNYRFNLRQLCTLKLAHYLTFILVCFSVGHSILSTFAYNIQPSLGCVISNPIWVQYFTYFVYPVLTGLLPIIIASLFNILAYLNVRRIVRRQMPIVRRRLDRQMTAMVLMRVIIFVCFVSPFTIYRIYTINFPITPTNVMAYAIGQLIQAILYTFFCLNYSISFYVFVISSSRFRHQVKIVLVKKIWQEWKSWCFFAHNEITGENAQSHDANIELEENI